MQGRVLVALFALFLAGSHTGGQSRYVSRSLGVSFRPPSDWKPVKDTIIPSLVTYALPMKNGFAPNISVVTEETGKATLADYMRSTNEQIGMAKRMHVSTPKSTHLGGLDAYTWRGHLNLKDGRDMGLRQVACVHGGEGFVVTLFAPPAEMFKYDRIFDRMLASFKWTTPVVASR